MKYTILGFNQKLIVENKLSLNDILLLQYIIEANGQPNMCHIVKDEVSYVWLSHTKIREDLPILGYGEGTLKNKLSELKSKGLIQSTSVSNKENKGSRTYYSVTEKTTSLKNDVNSCSSNLEMTSNNLLNNTNVYNVLSKDNTPPAETFQFGISEKPQKKNLYQKCADLINDWTNIDSINKLLFQYLDLCMEMKSIRGANQWKGMLNTLEKVQKQCHPHTFEEIIEMSINYGWKTFYPINDNGKGISGKRFDEFIRNKNDITKASNVPPTKSSEEF